MQCITWKCTRERVSKRTVKVLKGQKSSLLHTADILGEVELGRSTFDYLTVDVCRACYKLVAGLCVFPLCHPSATFLLVSGGQGHSGHAENYSISGGRVLNHISAHSYLFPELFTLWSQETVSRLLFVACFNVDTLVGCSPC